MGDANGQKGREQPPPQVARVWLTFQERANLRSILALAPAKNEDEMDRSSRAIEAVEGADQFMLPKGLADDARRTWAEQYNKKIESSEETAVMMTVENAVYFRMALARLASADKIDGQTAYMIRRAIRRVRAVAEGWECPGVGAVGAPDLKASLPVVGLEGIGS